LADPKAGPLELRQKTKINQGSRGILCAKAFDGKGGHRNLSRRRSQEDCVAKKNYRQESEEKNMHGAISAPCIRTAMEIWDPKRNWHLIKLEPAETQGEKK